MQSISQIATIVIHGGCSVPPQKDLTHELQERYIYELKQAVNAAKEIIEAGGSSLDAVQAAVIFLEDSPLFNAGKGAVYNNQLTHELEASIMDGRTLQAGAVTNLTRVKNPVKLARLFLDKQIAVMMSGLGAEQVAESNKFEMVENSYFDTDTRYKQVLKVKELCAQLGIDRPILTGDIGKDQNDIISTIKNAQMGTVGAVCLDYNGNLAAATSTGGMSNKAKGRIGDSCIIGAGNYANNLTCAISCTGSGEHFQRGLTAYECSSLMKLKKLSLDEACQQALQSCIDIGGRGGIIGVDPLGNICCKYDTDGILLGWWKNDQEVEAQLYYNYIL